MFGVGISMFLASNLGLAPWDVLHQGLSHKTGLSVGVIIELVGVALLLLWIPFRLRPGIGTLLNAFQIGFVVDLVAPHLPHSDLLVWRVAYIAGGLISVAIGSGLYIGAGLGTGPRDGLMVGLHRRFGISIRTARTAVEVAVMLAGVALGGSVGVGTLAFMFGIGPLVHLTIPALRMHHDR